jgi:putative inorganic carbon (HCO3(-)) transporter
MGLLLTIVYIVLTIISPTQFGTQWADYHALVYLAVVTALFSLPNVVSCSSLRSSIQTYLLVGFIAIVGISQIANDSWSGAIQAWLVFLPSAAVYFFIVANATTLRRLKIITLAILGASLGLVVESLCGYYLGFLGDAFVLKNGIYSHGNLVGQILRLRGIGSLNDPNDFAQMILVVLPLIFVAWHEGRVISNSAFVLAPAMLLLWATYLTHSRGALIGLAVLALMAGYKRFGKVPSLVLAAMLGVAMMALDFTGGRDISASAGADRLSLWASGLEFFKSAPIFGVGFGNFAELEGQTAHNSFILPLAELGVIGATLWVALLVTTTMDLNRLIVLREEPAATTGDAPNETSDLPAEENGAKTVSSSSFGTDLAAPFEHQTVGYAGDLPPTEHDLIEVARMEEQSFIANAEYERTEASAVVLPFPAESLPVAEAALASGLELDVETGQAAEPVDEPIAPYNSLVMIRLALAAFMATGWLLSRTYSTTIYLVLGLATAAISLDPSAAEPRDHPRWISVTLAVEVLLIIFVYLVVRLRH